ncbi:nucleotide-binding universal stress UspA family protein [Streptacidiphilus sp. MAP12-16]|uniref:universal stress protein n=1 Tax=Streptacidiphilus sp. MAP12-16 TaxID=3156300 RepID=UPI003518E166
MNVEQPVIAGVDGSPQSTFAAQWAADEAVRRRVRLRLVHAGPWLDAPSATDAEDHDFQGAALRMLAHIRDEIQGRHPELFVDTSLVHDQVVEGLVSVSGDGGMLVLGSRGLGGFAGLLVGSVGLATAARAEAPTVVVRAEPDSRQSAPSRGQVVVGIDAGAQVGPVLEFAFAEAALRGAGVRAVHGWDLPPVWSTVGWAAPLTQSGDLQTAEAALLSQALLPWRDKFPDIEVVEDARIGGGARAVVEASVHADLVVVGRRIRPHDVGLRLGPVAHAALHHAAAPVAVVPHP